MGSPFTITVLYQERRGTGEKGGLSWTQATINNVLIDICVVRFQKASSETCLPKSTNQSITLVLILGLPFPIFVTQGRLFNLSACFSFVKE